MRISPVNLNQPIVSVTRIDSGKTDGAGGDLTTSFKDAVKNAVSQVNDLQNNADQLAVKVAEGDVEDVHQAMIAMQKAKLALDMTIQVRNKVIEAYQEIMRMQV
jgi:flagellar hook-basal body complex protein FliE